MLLFPFWMKMLLYPHHYTSLPLNEILRITQFTSGQSWLIPIAGTILLRASATIAHPNMWSPYSALYYLLYSPFSWVSHTYFCLNLTYVRVKILVIKCLCLPIPPIVYYIMNRLLKFAVLISRLQRLLKFTQKLNSKLYVCFVKR